MSRNTAWDVRQRAQAQDGPPPVWSGRSIVAGAAALFVGGVLAVEVYGMAASTVESHAPSDGPGGAVLILPFLACFGVPAALWGSLAGVLPLVWAARRLSVRVTGRDAWWWVPAVAAVAAVAVTAAVGIWTPGAGPLALAWLTSASLLTGAALIARDSALHGPRLLRTLGYGGLAAVAVFLVGAGVFGAGLLTEYGPPKVTAAQLAGTWSDGHGGTLRLGADGTARAEGLTDHESAYEDEADAHSARYRCTGTGRWAYVPGDSTTWDQRLKLSVEGCEFDDFVSVYDDAGWSIGGTSDHPKLNREYGDLDAPEWYTLTR
ncbi:hypothetical protein [Streptomyces sp. SID7909]|uniref:hypothetical protein n=1 Tax=Streptomyces sp. SID7909 TaxID=2706092 RepID=UPI001EF38139|nr:hypothetical protein [Streptomyces sp. SID7909]